MRYFYHYLTLTFLSILMGGHLAKAQDVSAEHIHASEVHPDQSTDATTYGALPALQADHPALSRQWKGI